MATRPMKLYWGPARADNFTTATADGEHDSVVAGYRFIRTEGYCLDTPEPGTSPLDLYYNDARGDNFTTATEDGVKSAIDAGYRLVRTEGYVWTEPRPGTVELRLFYNDARGDNFTTATQEGADSAAAAGYDFIRVEGYVYPQPHDEVRVQFPLTGHHSWQQSAMHMDADAVLTRFGQLRTTIHTWSTWKFKGFTGGCLAMVIDSQENLIHRTMIWPLGVDGTWVGRSRRVDVFVDELGSEVAARAARLELLCSHISKNRWNDIVREAKDKFIVLRDAVNEATDG